MFLNGTYGTILYKPYDIVVLSNGQIGIINRVYPSYTVTSAYSVSYTYHAYEIVDSNRVSIFDLSRYYTINPPDKNWEKNLTVNNLLLTDYSLGNALPYITKLFPDQDKWKFQWVAIHWVKLLKNLTEHSADTILNQWKLLNDSDILKYITEVGITTADISNNKFENIFSRSALTKRELNVGQLVSNQYIIITDKATNKTVLAKTIPVELTKNPIPQTSLFMDIASFGLKAFSLSANPLLSVITGLFGSSSGPEFAPPTYFTLLDGTIHAIQYSWKHNRWEGNIDVTILTNELGNLFDSNINDIKATAAVLGKTDALVAAINKLNTGVPLTPSEIANIKLPIKDIIKNQQNVIASLKTTGVKIPNDYEDKLSKGIPLTVEEENRIKSSLTQRLQELEQQSLKEKQYKIDTKKYTTAVETTTVSTVALQTTPVELNEPVKRQVIRQNKTVPKVQQDLLVYYNKLPKDQQYLILAGAGLILLLLVL